MATCIYVVCSLNKKEKIPDLKEASKLFKGQLHVLSFAIEIPSLCIRRTGFRLKLVAGQMTASDSLLVVTPSLLHVVRNMYTASIISN